MKKRLFIVMLILALLISGCVKDEPQVAETGSVTDSAVSAAETERNETSGYDISSVDAYLASVEEQASAIEYSLENEVLNQNEMNRKSLDLYNLWDGALNYLWGELKAVLPEDEFTALLSEQLIWIEEKETEQKEAAGEFEGGSLYPFIFNGRGAAVTEERVYELYDILMQAV